MKRYLITLVLLLPLLTVGCHKAPIPVHPGAISNVDSYGYDVLLVEQDAIASARASYVAGTLPAGAKVYLNGAITQYNTTLAAWQAYHAAGGNSSVVEQAISALIAAVAQLQQVLGKAPGTVPTTDLRVPMWIEPLQAGAL